VKIRKDFRLDSDYFFKKIIFCILYLNLDFMLTKEIIEEIKNLTIDDRFLVVEETLKSIKEAESQSKMESAVNELFLDYKNDKDLTSFDSLDFEEFYEAR